MIRTARKLRLSLTRYLLTLRRTFTPAQMAMMVILGLILSLMLFATVQLAVPYRPFVVYGYERMPETACPNEHIDLWLDSELKDELRRLDIRYYWSPQELSGERFGGEVKLYDVEPYDRRIRPSILGRQAPRRPGEVHLVTEYQAYGERWETPIRQDLTVVSEDVVTVLSDESERCR